MVPSIRTSPTDPLSVLVIEDDADARRIYSEYLRVHGWVVFGAADGRAGLDKAIDLDIAMPRVDGWTVLKNLRESSWTATIPVIVVSALNDVRDEAFEAGCDAYLAKPCPPEVLLKQIVGLLRNSTAKAWLNKPGL